MPCNQYTITGLVLYRIWCSLDFTLLEKTCSVVSMIRTSLIHFSELTEDLSPSCRCQRGRKYTKYDRSDATMS